jgi:TP901 family phage tail tape measure protein
MNDLQLKITLNGIDKTSRPLRNVMDGAKELAQQLKDTRNQLNKLNNTQKNVDGFVQLRKQFEEAKNKAKSLAIELKNTTTPTKALQREFNKATAETKKLKDKLTPLRAELHQSGISTKNLTQHQITLKNQITSVNQSIGQQSERLKQLNIRQQKISQIRSKYDIGMQRMAVLGGVGYGALSTGKTVARGMKNLLHVGYEFDASMSATQAVTRIDDKNDLRMLALRKQARELPLVSKFTDSEVAQGQYFLGRTGYNPDQILKAMPGMLNLSAAGDVDLGTTADIASNIQMAMGLPAEKMDHVADVLTAMFTRNNVDIPMLGESLKYSAGVGASFGQSLETIATLTAVMGNAGIQGSQAGTTLRQILVRLGTSNAVAKLGVKVADKNGNMRDVVDIMSEISEATKHMGNVQRAQINKQIAGQIGLTGFEVLLTQASTGFLKKMRGEQGEYDGEAARVAKTKLDNLAGDMTMLHAAFENISVELFEKNNDWLRSAIQGLTKFLHGVGEFLKKHPALSKALVVIGAGVAAITTAFGAFAIMLMSVFGPMLMTRFILSRLGLSLGGLFTKTNIAGGGFKAFGRTLLAIAGSPIKTLGAAFKGLGFIFTSVSRAFLLTPIGLAITAIIAVIVIAALVIRKYWEPIKAFFIGFWEGLKKSLSPVVEEFSYLEPFVTTIGNGFKWLGEKISGLINWFCDLFEPVKLTKDELKKIENAGESFGKNFGKTLSGLIKIINLFTRVITYPANLIYKYWQPASDFFIGFWEGLSESLSNISDELSSFMPIIKTVGDIFNWIGNKISNLITWFDDLLKPIEKTKTEFKGAKEAGRAFGDSIGTVIKSLIWLFKKLQEIIVNTIKDLLSIPQKIGELAKKIEETLTGEGDFFNKFTKIGSYIADGLIDGVNNKHGNIKVTMSNLGTNIGNWFKNTLDIHSPSRVFSKFGGYTIDGYIHGIEHNQSEALRSMNQLGKKISNRFKNTLDIHSPSRLFAKFGGHTIDGYVNGIERNQNDAIQSVGQLANSIITTGSQLSSGVVVDNRHPIRGTGTSGISQYYITINAAPGMNEKELARCVAKEIERRERNQSARYRSSLRDID